MKKITRKKGAAVVFLCAAVLGAALIFAKNYRLPVPFDPNHMSVKLYKAAVVTNQYGRNSLRDIDHLRALISEDSDQVLDAVKIIYEGIDNIHGEVIDRPINRNGREVKVFYYCYQETLWDRWFADPALKTGGEYRPIYDGATYDNAMYKEGFQVEDYEPQMIEIYYLPVKNLYRFESLSDEEYDRMRDEGDLIWSGIV